MNELREEIEDIMHILFCTEWLQFRIFWYKIGAVRIKDELQNVREGLTAWSLEDGKEDVLWKKRERIHYLSFVLISDYSFKNQVQPVCQSVSGHKRKVSVVKTRCIACRLRVHHRPTTQHALRRDRDCLRLLQANIDWKLWLVHINCIVKWTSAFCYLFYIT